MHQGPDAVGAAQRAAAASSRSAAPAAGSTSGRSAASAAAASCSGPVTWSGSRRSRAPTGRRTAMIPHMGDESMTGAGRARPPTGPRPAPASDSTASTSSSAAAAASASVGASIITRTRGSVPLGRISTRPAVAQAGLDRGDVGGEARRRCAGRARPPGRCAAPGAGGSSPSPPVGQRLRPTGPRRRAPGRPVSRPSPVVARSRKITCPDCSPPSDQPPRPQRLEDVAVADRRSRPPGCRASPWPGGSRGWS